MEMPTVTSPVFTVNGYKFQITAYREVSRFEAAQTVQFWLQGKNRPRRLSKTKVYEIISVLGATD